MHTLTSAVRELVADEAEFIDLLERRLAGLDGVLRGEIDERAIDAFRGTRASRRFLAAREASWDDGDENLVRGELDRWGADQADPLRDMASRLVAAAEHVGSIRVRPGTIWFLLWEMEGMLADLHELLVARSTERSGP